MIADVSTYCLLKGCDTQDYLELFAFLIVVAVLCIIVEKKVKK